MSAVCIFLMMVSLGLTAPAEAQIYSWRDSNGHLVLSNRRPDSSIRTYAVPEAGTLRTTRYATEERMRSYDDLIVEHARRNGVRTDLVRAVVQVESGFNERATSPKGALGLMQLMPETVRLFGVIDPFNPLENIRAGVQYLRQLLDRYQDDERLALAAYNAGPAAVDRHGQTVPPYRETRDYISRVKQVAGTRVDRRKIYKTTEMVDGRPVPRYSDRKPTTGSYEVVVK
jgi:soluble lytic murein transglycosylase-like protein